MKLFYKSNIKVLLDKKLHRETFCSVKLKYETFCSVNA